MRSVRSLPVRHLRRLALVALLAATGLWALSSRDVGFGLPIFVDVTRASGIDFIHENGAFGKKYMPETTGSGCAFFDYNRDGWQDLLLINGTSFPGRPAPRSARTALYRNDRDGTFTDVAPQLGLNLNAYGMGCAVGDCDNDGWPDVFITCLGPNHLFRNQRGRRFVEVTRQAGVAGRPAEVGGLEWKWSSSAAWLDYDRDGDLDLFVGNYVLWTPQIDAWCGHDGVRGYCPPNTYLPTPNLLYRNNGNLTFTEVSAQTGIRRYEGKCWGVSVCDFDGDGFLDLAIANDTWPNFLFRNINGRRFEEIGVEAGVAFDDMGKAKAGMGIDAGDFANDGRFGLLIGNFSSEGLSLFRREKSRLAFTDVSRPGGIAESSLPFLTFGLFFFDYDLDGDRDFFCANGHIDDIVGSYESKTSYAQRPLLYRNLHQLKFEEVGTRSGAALAQSYVLRGCAYGDYDRDGDPDMCVVSNNPRINGGRAMLWRNDGGNRNHWIRFRLRGRQSNREGFGSVVTVKAGDLTQTDLMRSGSSYLSQSEPLITFGLGPRTRVDGITVRWPGGRRDVISQPLQGDREYELREGSAKTSAKVKLSAAAKGQ